MCSAAATEACLAGIQFLPLEAAAFFAIELQDRQRSQYGMDPLAIGLAEAEHYAQQPDTWMAIRGRRVLAILGISETFAGVQGVAFALLARDLGRDHLAITRFARDVVIGRSPLRRIEAIVRCSASWQVEDLPDPWLALQAACADPTPEIRWAMAVGLQPAAVLRNFGAASEPHMLLERIR